MVVERTQDLTVKGESVEHVCRRHRMSMAGTSTAPAPS